MAEIANNSNSTAKKDRRSARNRPMPKVDLTAMVDLAFLLITFFMLTTSLNTPNKLDIAMPDKNGPLSTSILLSEERTLNLLLGADNEITYYLGAADSPLTPPKKLGYGKLGLGALLGTERDNVRRRTNGEDIIVLIKPSEAAVTRNVVDALDAVQRASIGRYMITKIGAVEKEML